MRAPRCFISRCSSSSSSSCFPGLWGSAQCFTTLGVIILWKE